MGHSARRHAAGVRCAPAKSVFALCAALAALCAGPALAQQGLRYIDIEAERVQFQLERDAILFGGPVRAEYGETTITANQAQLETANNEVVFFDNVRVLREGQEIRGEWLWINLDTGVWIFRSATARLSPEFFDYKTVDYIYIHGETIVGDEHSARILNACLTTCVRPHPYHWSIEAEEIKLLEDGNKVKVSEGHVKVMGVTIMLTPSFSFSRRRARRLHITPQVGRNEFEGFWASVAYDVTDHATLEAKVTEKQGNTYSLDMDWRVGRRLTGRFRADYRTRSQFLTGDFRYEHRISRSTRLGLDYSLQRNAASFGTATFTQRASASFSRNVGRNQISLNATRTSTTTIDTRTNTTANLRIAQRIATRGVVETSLRFTEYDMAERGIDQELRTTAMLRYPMDFGEVTFLREERIDLDRERYPGDEGYAVLDKLPEVAFRTDLQRLGLADERSITLDVVYGFYREFPGPTAQSRWLIATRWRPRYFALGSSRLSPMVGFEQRLYGNSGAGIYYNYGAVLETPLGSNWRSTLGWSYQRQQGYTPFRFDNRRDSETARAGLEYRTLHRNFGLNTTYDVPRARFSDLLIRYTQTPNPMNQFSATTAYDLESGRWRTLLLKYRTIKTDRWYWDVSTSYDLGRGSLTTVASDFRWRISRRWNVEWLGRYSGFRQRFDVNRARLTYETDCAVVTLEHDAIRNDTRLNLRIRAFPSLAADTFRQGRGGEYVGGDFGAGAPF